MYKKIWVMRLIKYATLMLLKYNRYKWQKMAVLMLKNPLSLL